MTAWFSKMLLKILKPLAKFAIIAGLISALMDLFGGSEEEPGEDATDAANPEV